MRFLDHRSRAAQATVEFALFSLVFIPFALGGIEIGRGVWYYNQLSQLSREGVRWIIVTTADSSTDYLRVGNTPGTYSVATCGCDPDTAVGWIGRKDVGIPRDRLTVEIQREALGVYTWGIPVTVTVRYPYQPIVASFLNIPATINLRAATTMHMQ
jgi:hypothetical protein